MDEVEAYQRATRRKRRLMVGGVIALACSPVAYFAWTAQRTVAHANAQEAAYRQAQELDDRERAELRKLLADSATTLDDERARWRAAVAPAALAALVPGERRCGAEPTDYTLFSASAPIGENPDLAGAEETLARVGARLRADEATKEDLREARMAVAPAQTVFIVGTQVAALALGSAFLPGTITGTGYVFDFARGRIDCMGELAIQSSSAINFSFYTSPSNVLGESYDAHASATSALARDLEVQAKRALATQLRGVAR